MTAQIHTVHFGRHLTTEPGLAFSLWRAGRDPLRSVAFGDVQRPSVDALAKQAEDLALACEWLRESGNEVSLWLRPPTVDGSGVIRVHAARRRRASAARLLDAAAARFGLVWFDGETEETSLPLLAGDIGMVTDALDALGHAGEGWLVLESADDHGAFVQVSMDLGDLLARVEAPATPGFGEFLSRAAKAQLKLLGFREPQRADDDAYAAELAVDEPGVCATGAELVCRTLSSVYGVAETSPAVLRVRVDRGI